MARFSLTDDQVNWLGKEWQRIDTLSIRARESAAMPSASELEHAHQIFFEKENRDVFYRSAIILMPLAFNNQVNLSPVDVVAIVLQTWNKQYYRFHPWNAEHSDSIEQLFMDSRYQISITRDRHISSCTRGLQGDELWICLTFSSFQKVLGPVGAAKVLHLLAPQFFPLWDRNIAAKAYKVPLDMTGYVAMIRTVQFQRERIGGNLPTPDNFLKLIDEYNYCRYSKNWIE